MSPPVRSSPRKARKSTRGYGTRSSAASLNGSPSASQMTTQPLPSPPDPNNTISTGRIQGLFASTPSTSTIQATPSNRRVLSSSNEGSDNGNDGQANKKQHIDDNDSDSISSDDSYAGPKTSPSKKKAKTAFIEKKKNTPTSQMGNDGKKGKSTRPGSSQMRDQASTSYDDSSDLGNLSSKCVSYILIADKKKHSIKKTDILKHVFEGYDNKLFPGVFEKVKDILKQTFGFELEEVSNRKNEYILINALDRQLGVMDFGNSSDIESYQQGLIFYILTVIFMNGNNIEEDKLWKSLAPLDLDVNSRTPNPLFGDIKKFVIDSMQKKLYIERKLVCKDPEAHEIVWGDRAMREVNKLDCLKFACEIMDSTQPQDWIMQYKDAMESNPEENDV